MQYYPLFIDLTSAHCLIVGAGPVGKRKLQKLIKAQTKHILIVDPLPPKQDLKPLLKRSTISYEQREFNTNDILEKTLVFAATNNKNLNKAIATYCISKGILCNIVDAPSKGNFIVPSFIEQHGISIAISTNGNSPALSKKLREDITEWLGDRYAPIIMLLSRLRPLVLKTSNVTTDNTALFHTILNSGLSDAIKQKNRHQCEHILKDMLPNHLQIHLMELLHDLV